MLLLTILSLSIQLFLLMRKLFMEINYRTITVFFITMAALMSQAHEHPLKKHTVLQNEPQRIKNISKYKLPGQCKKPVQVVNIWSLEPLLVKKGLINQSMSKKQKRGVIQEYIKKKNSQYKKCLKSIKGNSLVGNKLVGNKLIKNTGLVKKCKKPSPTPDKAKLESLLIKRNQIHESMNKQQRQDVLQAYINKQKARYRLCILGSNNQ